MGCRGIGKWVFGEFLGICRDCGPDRSAPRRQCGWNGLKCVWSTRPLCK